MSVRGVADTHTAVWYLFGDPRLSIAAKRFIDAAAQDFDTIAVSSISLVEVVYLIEKGRIALETYEALGKALTNPRHVFVEAPLTQEVVNGMMKVPRTEVPDMPDRIVAATGIHLAVPVISRDRRIRGASLQTIW